MPDTTSLTTHVLDYVGGAVSNALTPTLRLGVTGLSRSGKTVFVTALVHNLVFGGRLPFFGPLADGRLISCHLEPQPDDHLPRFDFERHRDMILATPPHWPSGTQRISQLRLVFTYEPEHPARRLFGPRKLNLDIIDYPGEWLIDLSMLQQSFAAWSAEAIDVARDKRHREVARAWLDFQRDLDPYDDENEDVARKGADIFKDYLTAARAIPNALSTLGPGRFLMPGDLEGSPLLTFFPLDLRGLGTSPRGSLAAMMARRYESYREHVVRPFFRDHFRRIDRQIVLVDVLNAVNAGSEAVTDLQVALGEVLTAFRPGANSWLSTLLGRKTDRVLFAATKADHLPHGSYDRLEAILRLMVERALENAEHAGAKVDVAAIAALRATREGTIKKGEETLPCIVGVPLKGERLGEKTFDGEKEAAIFPGDLPADPLAALGPAQQRQTETQNQSDGSANFVRFAPPTLSTNGDQTQPPVWPHIRLDRTLDFLIGDWLS